MDDDHIIEEMQAVVDQLDLKYEEECRNRVNPSAVAAAGVIILIVTVIIVSILTCVFG